MATPTATVFGGSGFVGRYTVGELARRGYRVRVAVRRPDRALFLKPLGDVGQITPIAANVRDDASVATAVEGVDTAINLVGVLYETGAQRFQAVHAEGAGRIARSAAAAGVGRMVHVSAIGAMPDVAAEYARSKAAGEEAVREAFPASRNRPPEHRVRQGRRFSQSFRLDRSPRARHPADRRRGIRDFSRSMSATSPRASRVSPRTPGPPDGLTNSAVPRSTASGS